jgi:hypothetical protein
VQHSERQGRTVWTGRTLRDRGEPAMDVGVTVGDRVYVLAAPGDEQTLRKYL